MQRAIAETTQLAIRQCQMRMGGNKRTTHRSLIKVSSVCSSGRVTGLLVATRGQFIYTHDWSRLARDGHASCLGFRWDGSLSKWNDTTLLFAVCLPFFLLSALVDAPRALFSFLLTRKVDKYLLGFVTPDKPWTTLCRKCVGVVRALFQQVTTGLFAWRFSKLPGQNRVTVVVVGGKPVAIFQIEISYYTQGGSGL